MQSPRPTTRRAIAPAPTATSAGLTRSFGAQLLLALLLAPLLLDQRRVSCLMSNSVEDWVSGSAVVCNGIPGLTKEQRELCHRSPDVTVAAIKGIEMAIAECQHQFQWHRWNCSSLTPSSVTQHSSVILQRGYRETGFVYAISSAGVAHSVSRACSMGRLISCGCDPSSYTSRTTGQVGNGKSPPSAQLASRDGGSATQWKWGGCSHNLEFGVEFSKQFLDGREVAGDIQSTVNLHNNQAGRNAVSNNMQIRCKCHGMSGSCELKTCWKVVPDFRIVGRTLKNRFRNAVAVTQSNFGNVTPLNRVRGASRRRGHGRQERKRKHRNSNSGGNGAGGGGGGGAGVGNSHRGSRNGRGKKGRKGKNLASQLFFFQKSPNFCERDPHTDIAGTSGRRCNRPSAGGDGCASLCCGRGYNVVRQRRLERCACKFHWCCFVQCQNCTVEEWITVCK
ncbi:protein Wnt-10a isoform X3 [Phymastichus coffea]|uniref:protein Wnt-10a isoform X3 n=1 Tax=Phymastichus coffea TaxID=108790 RepID=UPI00273C3ED1|nr:protein Wnt-10a isoform X3 [Phymastichus coffea]